jgi:nitrogen fixation protein NifB
MFASLDHKESSVMRQQNMTENNSTMRQGCGSQKKGGGCGSSGGAAGFSMAQAEKVAHHPCYSPNAHHKYARMHLAVAPACNVQCNYCNRKYDCANESRPGVVSELLNVEQALQKARAVAAAIPQLSVIGIAGPGDPLANQTRTFDTLEGLRSALPNATSESTDCGNAKPLVNTQFK